MTDVTHLLASLVKELCWEWTCTNTCTVSLHDTEHLANLVRTDTETCASSCADGV